MRTHALFFGFLAGCLGCQPSVPQDASCTASNASELQAFAAQRNVDCVIEIGDSSLRTLDALAGLQTVGGFVLRNNAELTDVSTISTLQPFRVLSVEATPLAATTDVSPAEGDLYIVKSSVRTLLGSQDEAAVINVSENDALAVLDFGLLVRADSLVIEDNPALETISFPALTSVSQLSVRNSPLLSVEEIDALAARANVPSDAVLHCGNAGDDECPPVETLQ